MLADIEHFLSHEEHHRKLFGDELSRRGLRRCASYHLCGFGGLALGLVTGLLGPRSIAITTEAVEGVVLSHLTDQQFELMHIDPEAAAVIGKIIADEQEHHDTSAQRLGDERPFDKILRPTVRVATEMVFWMG